MSSDQRTAHICGACGRLTSTIDGRVDRHTDYRLLPGAVTCEASDYLIGQHA